MFRTTFAARPAARDVVPAVPPCVVPAVPSGVVPAVPSGVVPAVPDAAPCDVRPAPATSRLRRALEVTAFTAVWIGLGIGLHLDPNVYLLVGIPLTVAFQLGVRRRPLRELWVRDGGPFRLDTRALLIALALAVLPVIWLGIAVSKAEWVGAAWMLACLPGAAAAGYAVTRLRAASNALSAEGAVSAGGAVSTGSVGTGLARGVRAALIAFATGTGIFVVALVPQIVGSGSPDLLRMLGVGLQSALLYIPVTFMLEEVTFRGLLDSHLHEPGESRGWLSALFVSALWGLWHLPEELGTASLPVLIGGLLVVHCAIGVSLSFAWRRSGNLALPATAHALIDGVRNGLQAGL